MRCPICEETDMWENVDKYRTKPQGMAICNGCGFVSYPDKYQAKDEIIKYYEKEYRAAPNVMNIYTSERKMHYHGEFLKDVIQQFKTENREEIVVTDIGSAFGMFLKWFRDFFPKGDYTGVELTKSFVRNAWHMYRIPTKNDFDDSKKYDLIASYKSLEHILDPDIELERYVNALKDDGYLYISVPTWFHQMKSFGMGGFDLEYYYSPNHINTWTRKHFEGLLASKGAKIVKENHTMYEDTYLCVRDLSIMKETYYEDPEEIKEKMAKIQEANDAYEIGDYDKAINIWPNFPIAHYVRYEYNRAKWHQLGFEEIYKQVCERALRECPDDSDAHYLAADICMRYGRYEEAIKHLNECNKLKPNMPNVFTMLGNCFRTLGNQSTDEKDKIKFFQQSRNCAMLLSKFGKQNEADAVTMMMHDNANIPTPFE